MCNPYNAHASGNAQKDINKIKSKSNQICMS